MNKFKKIILNNNIPLYLCIDSSMKNVFVSYNVLYGSSGLWFNFNNNGKNYNVISGYAHYLEHLLGEHSKFGNMYANFQRRLHYANAYTADNVTSYYFKGINDIEKSIEELIVGIEQPIFDNKEVDNTRHAIIEESASYYDNHGVILVDMVENNLYSGFNKYDETLSPIGNRETTKLITTEDLYNCYNAFYTDNNKFIVIAGNVNEEKIVDLLNNIYSKIIPHRARVLLKEIDYSKKKTNNDVLNRNIDTPISALGIKIKKKDNISMKELNYCMNIIKEYLFNSKQLNELNKSGLLGSFEYTFFTKTDDYINFILSFITSDKKTCCKEILEILSKKNISEKEYELLQKTLIANEIRSMDNKYSFLKEFPEKIYYSDSYSESEYYSSIDYNSFWNILSSIDFDDYTIGEVKKLKK